MKSLTQFSFFFLVLVYFSGTIGMLLNPSFFLPFTPYSLLLTSIVFLVHQDLRKSSQIFAFFAVAAFGFLSEYLGLKTGWIFGTYHYGEALGPKLAGVPVCISLNWALLVNAGLLVALRLSSHRLWTSSLAAILITGLDLLMEQLAPELDFWYFKGGRAGLHNYLGWILVSFAAAYLFFRPLKTGNTRIAAYVLFLQLLFFGTIFVATRLIL